eukprot:Rmarinus@m.15825
MAKTKVKTLRLFVESLVAQRVDIELTDGTRVTGMLQEVIQTMDLVLEDVTWTTPEGLEYDVPFCYVRGRQVMYVHVARTIDPASQLQATWDRRIRASSRNKKRSLNSLPGHSRQQPPPSSSSLQKSEQT